MSSRRSGSLCRRSWWILLLVLALFGPGCGRKAELLQIHGKPVAYWLEQLHAPDPKLRKKAVHHLGPAGAVEPAALAAVIRAVKDRDALVRREAVLALLNLGPPAAEAIPALTEARNDPDPLVRDYADKALQRIGPK